MIHSAYYCSLNNPIKTTIFCIMLCSVQAMRQKNVIDLGVKFFQPVLINHVIKCHACQESLDRSANRKPTCQIMVSKQELERDINADRNRGKPWLDPLNLSQKRLFGLVEIKIINCFGPPIDYEGLKHCRYTKKNTHRYMYTVFLSLCLEIVIDSCVGII